MVLEGFVLRDALFELIQTGNLDVSSLGDNLEEFFCVLVEEEVSFFCVHLVKLANECLLRLQLFLNSPDNLHCS